MHAPAINLVCTRCTDGNTLALQRWYADHVHLLLLAPELLGATLHCCAQSLHGLPPDYFCIYDFANHDDFISFERSPHKAQATELTNVAAGRASVDIVQRTQYTRWLHRQWPMRQAASAGRWVLAVNMMLDLATEAGWPLAAQRWLADCLQALKSCTPLLVAQVFGAQNKSGEAFMLLEFDQGDAANIWSILQVTLSQEALYGAASSLQMRWACSAGVLQAWRR